MIDNSLYSYMEELLETIPTDFYRYKYDEIDWEGRLTGIVGPRGVGKSTMVLQYIKSHRSEGLHLYVMADNAYFTSHSLVQLADDFVKDGGTHLYIDEIHKYKDWSRELKQIYDVHPALKVTFTGSSVLDIQQGEVDLSRRVVMETMQGLSFREFLRLFYDIQAPVVSLEDILNHNVEIPGLLHPLPYFREYLKQGYYPYALQGRFATRLQQVINQTIETDIPQYADMKASTARKLKQLLMVISGLAPMKPNADNLAREIGVSKNNVPDCILYLEKAGMIGQLRDDTGGLRGLGKVEKIYLDNPNLMYALSEGEPNIGNLRETFFYNQMRERNSVISSRVSDFMIGKYTFEVGGKKKGKKQISHVSDAFVVRDDIENGNDNIIPLWHFGLNY